MPDTDPKPLDPEVDLWTDKVCNVIGQGRVAPGPPPPPIDLEAARLWEQRSRVIEPDVLDTISRRLGDVSKLRASWMQATELAGAGRHGDALRLLERIASLIEEARKAGTDPTDGVPKDVVPFIQARLTWNKTRKLLNTELAKLETAIVNACNKSPALSFVLAETSAIYENMEALDERLEDALDDVVTAEEGEARDRRKLAARALVAEYKNELASEFFAEVDGKNGFTPVAVTASARKALDEIEKAIA